MTVPKHYSSVMPYFVVPDAEAFIQFLTAVFDAQEIMKVPRDDGSIMHAEYSINGGTVMFGQANDQWTALTCSTYVVTDKVDEIYQKGIEAAGTGNQEPSDYGYGRAAGFIDQWGNQWWLNDASGE